MPAYEWEVEQAVEEAVDLMPGWGPQQVLTRDGKVTGIELVKCTAVFDAQGRFAPQFDRTVATSLAADQIILAVGQHADLTYASELERQRGLAVVEVETQQTNLAGVYAGGDIVKPASVIEAVAAGRRAAYAIDASLQGTELQIPFMQVEEELISFDPGCLESEQAAQPAIIPVPERTLMVEDVPGLMMPQVVQEAFRCFNCACVAVSPSDLAPALIALDAIIHTTRRSLPADLFFAVRIGGSTILDDDEMVKEIEIPAPRKASRSRYLKFRLRQSIDFPILGLAVQVYENGNGVEDARLVLGAAAPVPLRLKETEAFLTGKTLSEQVASEAAELALVGASPLELNGYKLQIVKALVKRALLSR
jgi:CO/xanthine dehydrogenase FAD-binding subunit